MNTKEIKYERFIFSFEDLYVEAKKQFYKYEQIEGIKNWKKYDFSIDCAEDQMKLKDMLEIRFIEELTEASEAYLLKEDDHFWEEITDALNFFLSAYIMFDANFKSLPQPQSYLKINSQKHLPKDFNQLSYSFYRIIHITGNFCNILKNRPWSQSNYLVSLIDFNKKAELLWISFWEMLGDLGLNPTDIFILFEKKMKVNLWRINTKY